MELGRVGGSAGVWGTPGCLGSCFGCCRSITIPRFCESSRLPSVPSFQLATMRASTHSKPRRTLSQVLIYFLIFSTPYALWHTLCAISHTSSPTVVMTSESMEPVFQRGGVFFCLESNPEYRAGRHSRVLGLRAGDCHLCTG